MSVTTTPAPKSGDRPGGARNGSPGGRVRSLFKRGEATDTTTSELIEFYSPSQAIIAAPAKLAARNVVLILGSMVLVIFFMFGVLTMDRIVVANGKTVSMTPEIVVQPLNTSVVKTIAVSEGDIVRKGQLLAQLDPTFTSADNAAAVDQTDRYQTEVDRLTSELHQSAYRPRKLTPGAVIQEGIFSQRASAREAELRYYSGQIEAQRALLNQAEANVRQYAKETGVSVDVEKVRIQLERDEVGSRLDTLAATSARLESEREVLGSIQQAENARQTIKGLQGQLDNYNQQWFADVSQTITSDNVQLSAYRDQLEHAALNYKLIDLRAPQDSVVLSVAPVSIGTVLQSGQTFFTLVPINAPIEIQSQMTGDMSGFVFVGQPVEVKFQSFPFTEFGEAHGTVRLVSADSFVTNAGASTTTGSAGTTANSVFTGVAPTSPYFYDVRVTLDRLEMKNMPKDFRVVPGMPVEADIKVGERTIWDYLIERMLPIIEEGMREPV